MSKKNELNIKDVLFEDWIIYEKKKGNKMERTIYYNKKNQLFMKIWNDDYIWKNNFINAYKCNYYDNISFLEKIIVNDKGDTLGYINKELKPHNLKIQINSLKNQNILCDNSDNDNYIFFLNKIKKKAEDLKLVHIDITPYNIGILDNKIYIFDLESVVILKELNNMDYWKNYNPQSYVNYIINLNNS